MDYYELTTAGTSPLSLADAKSWMKVTSTADDALIQVLIDACTEWGQKFTAREFTANTYTLLMDCLFDRMRLNRNPIDTITSIKHLVSGSLVTVASTVYYKKDLTQWAEILLEDTKAWPTNTDDKEHAIEIIFVTEAYNCGNLIEQALKMHVAYWYANRGDCDCQSAGKQSGAEGLYSTIRISRI